MKSGILFLYRKEQGFGMIAVDGSGEQVFLHHADLPAGLFDTLAQGDRVEFDTLQDAKGSRATNVKKTSNPGEKITVTETDQDGIPGIGGQFKIRVVKKKKAPTKARPAPKKKRRK